MGDDADIVVLSFKVKYKDPAKDLVEFIEKGYDWVLDGDTSAGEREDGSYLVFVELSRSEEVPKQIMRLVEDILNLTEQDISEWHWKYHKSIKDFPMTLEALQAEIPTTPEAYKERFESEDQEVKEQLDRMRQVAQVEVKTTAPVNEYTDSLRIAAGIK
jgi:hypothetical protein